MFLFHMYVKANVMCIGSQNHNISIILNGDFLYNRKDLMVYSRVDDPGWISPGSGSHL